ncbi:MAG: hypothetical protein K2H68_04805 [Bacteroidales bacterium]|nr:hypothetical protein [Bacteroidales bacterium]
MKNYLKVCLLALLTMSLFAACKPDPDEKEEGKTPASGLSFTATCNGKTLVDGATITVSKKCVAYDDMEADFLIKNTSTSKVDFSMKFEEAQPEDAILTICGFGGCKAGNSIDNETLEPGKTYGGELDKIDIAYIVGENVAKATMKVTMSDNTAGKDLVFTLVFDPTRDK